MHPVLVTGAAVLTLAALLALTHVPLGTWVGRGLPPTKRDWRVERALYRSGIDPDREQRWTGYAVSVSPSPVSVGIAALFLLILVQGRLPLAAGRSMDVAHRRQHRCLLRDQHQLAVVCR